jgi:2',3'-cyclic-nucleotide 2'-phosphodiesterase (5'-nucleotidase family)
VIGLILENLAGVVAKKSVEPFAILDVAESAQTYINLLDPQTDLIVLLTHNGIEYDSLLATRIHNADIIVGGHSHTRLKSPLNVNNVIIVQAGSYCTNIGVLELTVDADSVSNYNGKLVELILADTHPQKNVKHVVDSLEVLVQSEFGEVIGEAATSLPRSYYSTSPLGNLLCDFLRKRYAADVAFVNTGGIRKDISAGVIRKLDIIEMLPFTNNVVTLQLTGSELIQIAQMQARGEVTRDHGILEMSGMTITYVRQNGGVKLEDIRINDKPVDLTRTYSVATIDYVTMSQPEQYLGFIPASQENTGELISDAIIDEIQKAKQPVAADTARRLIEVK